MTSAASKAITLDDLLFNRKSEPYTLRALFAYLDAQLAPELLDFWLAAQDVRNMYEPEHPRSSFSMNRNHSKMEELSSMERVRRTTRGESLDDVRSKTPSVIRGKLDGILAMAQELKRRHSEAQILVRATYVDEDAPLCINLSNEMRVEVLSNCPKTEQDDPVLGLFDRAMEECELLIQSNYLQKFIRFAEATAATGGGEDVGGGGSALRAAPVPPPMVAKPPPPRPQQPASNSLPSSGLETISQQQQQASSVPKPPPPRT